MILLTLEKIAPWVAIFVSITALLSSYFINRKLNRQQESINDLVLSEKRRNATDIKKADVRIESHKENNREGYIIVTNQGLCIARNIIISCSRGKQLMFSNKYDPPEIEQLLQGETSKIGYTVNKIAREQMQLYVQWDDEYMSGNRIQKNIIV